MKRFLAASIVVLLIFGMTTQTRADQPGIPNLFPKQTISFGASDTAKSVTISGTRGMANYWVMAVPNWTNVVTATLSVTDMFGNVLWSDSARAENTTYVYAAYEGSSTVPILPLAAQTIWTVTLSGVPGGTGGDVTLSVYTR